MLLSPRLTVRFASGTRSHAREIHVKYRATPVDISNGYFQEINLKQSSFVNEMFYDGSNEYLLVRLKNTFYHYCEIPAEVINKWITSPSLGGYYNASVKGKYDCRVNRMPVYAD